MITIVIVKYKTTVPTMLYGTNFWEPIPSSGCNQAVDDDALLIFSLDLHQADVRSVVHQL